MVRQQYAFINYDRLHLEKVLFYPVGQKNASLRFPLFYMVSLKVKDKRFYC